MLEISDYLFEIIACAALGGSCFALHLQRRELLRLRTLIRCERGDRQALENDVAALLACSRNMGERVRSQDARQISMSKKLDVFDTHREPAGVHAYDQAHKLVAQGMGIEQISEICDLQRGEIELLSHIALHKSAA